MHRCRKGLISSPPFMQVKSSQLMSPKKEEQDATACSHPKHTTRYQSIDANVAANITKMETATRLKADH